ncbi:MAG TPA: type II secretion system F family protein [Candidatus Eisenbacteria bacterium]|nr:type II secretion system F family protein [Candidatus Eisenbacteria bacterium]
MPDLTLALIAAAAGGAWALALWYLGLYTHPAALSWQRLARLRGLDDRRPLGDRVGDRLPLLWRAQEETDVGRLLAVAGQGESAAGWLLRSAFHAGLALTAVLLADELALLTAQPPPLPPAVGLLAAASVAILAYARLRRQAAERQRALGRAVADSLPHLAVMTFHHRVPVAEALLIFARCQRDPALRRLLADDAWRPLVERHGSPGARSTALEYERIGQAYGVPMFSALGSAVQRVTERGLTSQDVYTGLARASYGERLAAARVAAAQAKTLIVVPMGLMIVPVLVLIGAPLVASLAGIFAR